MTPDGARTNRAKAPLGLRLKLRELLPWTPSKQRSPLNIYVAAAGKHRGSVVRIQASRLFSAYLISRPEHVKYVLTEHHRNYRKGKEYAELKIVANEGLLSSEGAFWLRQRRLIQPAFRRE